MFLFLAFGTMCCTLLESDVVSRVSLGSEVFAVDSMPKREGGCCSVRTTLVPIAAVSLALIAHRQSFSNGMAAIRTRIVQI